MRLPPHWRKAPVTLLHHRPVLVAVTFGAFLVALASASSPFFTAAAGSAALKDKLHELTPRATGLELTYSYQGGFYGYSQPGAHQPAPKGLRTAALRAEVRLLTQGIALGKPVLTTLGPTVQLTSSADASRTDPVQIAAHSNLLRDVRVLRGDRHADGIWISDTTALMLRAGPGDRIALSLPTADGKAKTFHLTVAGVYRALWRRPETPAWINFRDFIFPISKIDPVQPPTFAFVTERTIDRLFAKADPGGVQQFFELPLVSQHPLLSEARRIERQLEAVHARLTGPRPPGDRARLARQGFFIEAKDSTSLPQAIGLADTTIAAVAPPTRLLAEAGALIALIVVGASGAFLVVRRRAEARALFARGEAVPSFAARTLVEALLPSVAGSILGFATAFALIRAVEPNGSIEGSTLRDGALTAAGGVAAGLLFIAVSAGVTYARLYEVGRRTHPLLRRAPWELVALGAGLVLLVRLHQGSGLDRDPATGISHPSLASFLVPLLLVGGGAALVARVGSPGLRRAAGRAWGLPLPAALALRRLAAGRGVLALLVVTCAVALGLLLYAQTLVSSLQESVRQKAYIAAGSDVQALVDASEPAPRGLGFPVTRVETAYGGGRLGGAAGAPADVLEVDPKTLPGALHWISSWGPPVAELVAHLDDPGPRLNVLVTGKPFPVRTLYVSGTDVPVRATWVRAFPGMSANAPLVVVSQARLTAAAGGMDPLVPVLAALWAKGPTDRVVAALEGPQVAAFSTTTARGFRTDPNVALALRTFSFMRALGIGAGALALFCLVLYLLARQRAQTIATAFGRRMGLRRGAAAASLALELGLILGVALVVALTGSLVAASSIVSRSDPLPVLPPAPVFAGPWVDLIVLSVGLVAVALIGGTLASRPSRNEAIVEALRLE